MTNRVPGVSGAVCLEGRQLETSSGLRIRGSRVAPPNLDWLLPRLLLVSAWLYSIVPATIRTLQGDQGATYVSVTETLSPIALLSQRGLWLGTLGLAGFIILRCALRPTCGLLRLCLALLPWGAIELSAVVNGTKAPQTVIVVPAFALALWLSAPDRGFLRLLGPLTLITASFSLAIALLTEYGVRSQNETPDAKGFFTADLLAGPYGSPNTLGMALALGFPFVLDIRHRAARSFGVVVVATALFWASSRTSVLAVCTVAAAYLILRFRVVERGAAGFFNRAVVGGLGVLVVLVPLFTTAASSFSGRGRIWLSSVDLAAAHPWTGLGPNFFRTVARSYNQFGFYAFHGHNLFVNVFTTTGVIGLSAWIIFLAVLTRIGLAAAGQGYRLPLLYILAFLSVGVLEVATDFNDLSQLGYITILPMLSIVISDRRLLTDVQRSWRASGTRR